MRPSTILKALLFKETNIGCEKKGFSPRWRKWMSGCLSSVSFAILVNGSAKGWVKASRGLRQGDPLSPFLFTLVADVLSRMLMRAEERNMEEELQTLKSLLLVFGHISGLKVNLNKSSIYGINLDQAHLSRLAEMLDCKASGWPILYLGLPLGGNPKACGFWDPVVERISSRLDGWQKAYLSFGGRITLIQSCLTHLPSYFLSLFKMPATVAAKIERLQRDFLWSGVGEGKRDHLVRWDIVCRPKTIGGLGLGNISWRNLALLGKWLWRYPREGSTLWHQVILSIYGSHSNGWDANTVVRWSHRCPWKAIAQVFQEFSLITRVVVDKNISISSVLGPSRPFLWNLNFRRNLSDSEIEDLEGLMRSLDDLYLSPSVPDARLWPLSSSGLFSVKSFFLALSQSSGSSQNFPSKFVWNSQVPFKMKSFVWGQIAFLSNLASIAKQQSFGRAGLMSLAECIASAANDCQTEWCEDAGPNIVQEESASESVSHNDKTVLLDALRFVVECSKQHFNPNYRLRVCERVLEAAASMVCTFNVPLEVLLHFISALPREFTDCGGAEEENQSNSFADKILSWNTRGLGSKKKRRIVRRFLSTQNPDIVMLQETKRETWDRSKFECTEKVLGSFSVTVKFNSGEEGSFWLTSVYGPINPLWRKDFWLELQDLYGLTFPRWESGLLDPPLRNAAFTWSNMQADPICKRLDRFLFSSEWDTFFSQSFQEALPRWTSDHSPICLETNPLKWGPTPFRFENMWLLHPEFKEKFRVWWQECRVKGGKDLKKKELEDVLLKEEVQWRQKSRVKWIKEGDCNSNSFIEWPQVGEVGSSLSESWRVEGIDWVPISGESGVWLDRPFTEEEVRMAVFQLNKEKAPGPDGFTIAVYQECWDVIKEDLMRVFLEFHTNGGVYAKFFMKQSLVLKEPLLKGDTFWMLLIANEVVDEKEDHVLQRKGFSQKWRSWIRGCLSSSSFAILVNGNAKGWVKASRGLRQGDPLSPFLFTLVADVLREGKKDHLVRWEVVSRPKELGGLGFGKISLRNIALLGKWLWRFPRERSGLWHKVIVSIYGTHPNGWDANMVVRWSHRCPWKAIAQVFQIFPFVRLVVGNGERIRFGKIFWGFLWSSKVPSKVKALAWIVAHGKVNTNDKLQLRRPYKSLCPQWCILCKGNGESIDHLFLHCPVTIGLWNKLFKLAGLDWVPPRSFEDMLVIAFKGLGNSLRGKTLWQVACLTLVWIVWQERNNRIFEDKGRSEETLWDLILFYSTLWASCFAAFRGVPLNVLQLNWRECRKDLSSF
ncbi:putative ribonuclease H protein [Vitis vinifera]|uniref:Putative ribonuclease H protein n=1 Tax=Vitis vinifera TaxID=29760 RepID=A0A438ESM4_VITVI|nr:putative ribonuclease H protein [Vitis vinifera]